MGTRKNFTILFLESKQYRDEKSKKVSSKIVRYEDNGKSLNYLVSRVYGCFLVCVGVRLIFFPGVKPIKIVQV